MTYVEATYVTYADVCNLQETAWRAVEALSAAEARIAAITAHSIHKPVERGDAEARTHLATSRSEEGIR
jgi:hypothetical protein